MLTLIGTWMAHPAAFVLVAAYGLVWTYVEGMTWEGGAALATWFMTLLIQRAEHRDTQALHAKLDEILHATGGARNALSRLDDREPEDIEKDRETSNKDD